MPGPPLSATFTYDGTPGNPPRSEPFNRLDRIMIQTQRMFNSGQIGTHSRIPMRKNIPQNSDGGVGASTGGLISTDSNAVPNSEE